MSANQTVQPKLVIGCQPRTERAQPTKLSTNADESSIIYSSGRHIYIKDLETSSTSVISNHSTAVSVAKFSVDNKYILSGDVSGTLKVSLNNEEFSEKYMYPILNGKINDISSSMDSSKVLVVGQGSTNFASCISLDTGNTYGEIMGHSKPILAADFKLTRTDPRLVTGGMDFSTILFKGNPYSLLKVNRDHNNMVFDVKFDKKGKIYGSVGADKLICIYDGLNGDLLNKIESGHTGSILSFSFNKEGDQLVTSSADKTIKIFDITTSKTISTLNLGDNFQHQQVSNLWLDKYILSLSLNGDLNYVDPKLNQVTKVVQGYQQPITALHVDPQARTFLTGSLDGRVHSWDLLTETPKNEAKFLPKGPEAKVVTFTDLTNANLMVIAADDTLRSLGQDLNTFSSPLKLSSEPAASCKIDEQTLAVVTLDDQIHITKENQVITSTQLKGTPTSITYLSQHNIVVVGIQSKPVQTFELNPTSLSLQPTTSTGLTHSNLTALSSHTSTSKLVLGDGTGKIFLYDTSALPFTIVTSRWSFHTSKITSLSFSLDGNLVVSGAVDGYIYVWNTQSVGKKTAIPKAHSDPISQVQFGKSTDEMVEVLSAADDGTLKIFEVKYPN